MVWHLYCSEPAPELSARATLIVSARSLSVRSVSDLAAFYVERVNAAAKDCMPEGSTLLTDLPLEMFTILRMNAEFIEYNTLKQNTQLL